MDAIVAKSDAQIETARRRVEVNFLKHRAKWQSDNSFDGRLYDVDSGQFIDISKLNNNQLLDNYNLVMLGRRNGVLNTIDGFTISWAGELTVRSDGRKQIPLPDFPGLRNALLNGVAGDVVSFDVPPGLED